MKRALSLLLAALALVLPGLPALAQATGSMGGYPAGHSGARVVAKVTWVEEWDPASQQWVRVEDSPASIAPAAYESAVHAPVASSTTVSVVGGATVTETVIEEPVRFITRPAALVAGMGPGMGGDSQFGPFRVLDGKRAALVGATDVTSPAAFRAMMAAYPGLEVIEFLDAPGTSNDIANLALGRAIRAAGLATHVPDGGSARSGAVELFLAGTRRTVDAGALFAVHSWRDALGREPVDFGPDAPENRLYLDYYAEMGMTADEARAFYAMTNSVPHERALWLRGSDMAQWIAPEGDAARERVIDASLAGALRQALLRSGNVLAEALKAAPWRAPTASAAAPRLAYADTGAGLLDSPTAFP